jgi:hypothetical protein
MLSDIHADRAVLPLKLSTSAAQCSSVVLAAEAAATAESLPMSIFPRHLRKSSSLAMAAARQLLPSTN